VSLTDHYKILELSPSATLPEIKKAYRRLALQYHPDKNNNDPYAAAYFDAVKEAYETLTDAGKKNNYLQQRWYQQSTGKGFSTEIQTPVTILQRCIILEKTISLQDVHRLDEYKLAHSIDTLLNEEAVTTLKKFADIPVNDTIASLVLKISQPASYPVLQKITALLQQVPLSEKLRVRVQKKEQESLRSYKWGKYRTLFILLLTAVLCLTVYLMS